MRELKFRAWDKSTNLMWCDIELSYTLLSNPNMAITQYTGLKDKNGTKIYGGDIVEKWCHCKELERLSPFYNEGVGYYKSLTTTVKWSEQGLNYNIYPHHDDAYWKVIGNIYENKELLK